MKQLNIASTEAAEPTELYDVSSELISEFKGKSGDVSVHGGKNPVLVSAQLGKGKYKEIKVLDNRIFLTFDMSGNKVQLRLPVKAVKRIIRKKPVFSFKLPLGQTITLK